MTDYRKTIGKRSNRVQTGFLGGIGDTIGGAVDDATDAVGGAVDDASDFVDDSVDRKSVV